MRERDSDAGGTEMQLRVNEWIKSGRSPVSPSAPGYIVSDAPSNETRCCSPAVLSRGVAGG